MKKTIVLLLLFLSLIINAQEKFKGTWQSKTTTYKTVIIASKYAVLKVFNYSFEDKNFIEQDIIKQNNNEFTTVLYNPRNGYKVTINYYMKDENIMCTYIGDFNGTVILYKK